MKKTILILGGARSGKSRFAVELAAKLSEKVLFVATATAGDEEMRQRIEQHKKDRPAGWRTLEAAAHIGQQIEQKLGDARLVLIDCITLLAGNIFSQHSDAALEHIEEALLEQQLAAEIAELLECMKRVNASFIIVSNEVGLDIVPANRAGRLYRDLLGKANQVLAQNADEVYFMVAGLPLKLKPADSR